jgi:hypothetical protein
MKKPKKAKRKKKCALGGGFYPKLLSYMNEGLVKKRLVSHLRCKMSKFFDPIKSTDSPHYTKNGKLRFGDLLVHFKPTNVLHTSKLS